jgi:putative component of toxin-antitoxin plasmid stabilization module
MNRFALADIEQVKGKINFKKLVINGVCQFEDFCVDVSMQGNLEKELDKIFSRMNQVANMLRLPKEKFRDITPAKETIKEFEIKTANLRVYLIKEEGHIVVLGGKKNSQKEDIKQFRAIKKQYLKA